MGRISCLSRSKNFSTRRDAGRMGGMNAIDWSKPIQQRDGHKAVFLETGGDGMRVAILVDGVIWINVMREPDGSHYGDTGQYATDIIQSQPVSAYDAMCSALAVWLKDGVIVQNKNGNTYWCSEDPRIPFGGPIWEEKGLWPTGDAQYSQLQLSGNVELADDYRLSLRRIVAGRITQGEA